MPPAFARLPSLLALALLLGACAPAPKDYPRTVTRAPTQTQDTFLAARARALGDPGDGRSGFHLVSEGTEALALRLLLAERAEHTIDAQYYLVHDDPTGHLFAWSLLKAADRGVRVRLLVDDMDTRGYDTMTAALDAHPGIEIRLFNPFRRDVGKALGALTEFSRINRRMHNKSMTFDNVVTIVGGRNIGAEYFAAREDSNYDDLDLLGAGPIAREVSESFDAYWNAPQAVPARAVIGDRAGDVSLEDGRARLAVLAEAARSSEFGAALSHGIARQLYRGDLKLAWVPARVVADPPEKAAGAEGLETVSAVMTPYLQAARKDLFVSSAYFVPRDRGVALLSGIRARGVRVVILTNSLDSTDVEPVHGHYARARRDMLEAGIELWELRPDKSRTDRAGIGLGQSQSGLHTKAFAIDGRHLFVGSFNWDPRSVRINTEMGILLDSPALTQEVVRHFEAHLPRNAYELRLDEAGGLEWLERRGDGVTRVHRREPSDSAWRAFVTRVYGILPIGGQL